MMTLKHIILTMFSLSLFHGDANCQSADLINDTTIYIKHTKPLQLIDGQILGDGLFLSVNYDTRFTPGTKGLGFRVGINALLGTAIPVSVNYLIGNKIKRSFLEIGGGATFYLTNNKYHFFDENRIVPITYIMYRYQAIKSSNTFRIGVTQLYVFEQDYSKYRFYYPTLSLGRILGQRPK